MISPKYKKILKEMQGQEISWEDWGYCLVKDNKLIKYGKVVKVLTTNADVKKLSSNAFEDEFGYAPNSEAHKRALEREFGKR